jgi:hypothetical protein
MASQAEGKVAFSREGGNGSSLSTLYMIVVTLPVNGFSPVTNW